MEKQINSFDDLVFGPHRNGDKDSVQAWHTLPNGITISVVGGRGLYGDGINSFEIGAWPKEGQEWIKLSEHDDVIGWQNKDEVTKVIQRLRVIR